MNDPVLRRAVLAEAGTEPESWCWMALPRPNLFYPTF